MFLLLPPVKYMACAALLGGNVAVGTLYFTNDFLRPLRDYPNSIAGSTDMGKYWYVANIKKMSEDHTGLVEYPWIEATYSDPKSKSQDRFFASEIFRRCYGLRNRRNYLFNGREMEDLRRWCTLENDYLVEEFLEIFRWEFRKNCRIVWKKDPREPAKKNKVGWFLPYILQRIHLEKDNETFEKIRGIYRLWKENIYPWSEVQKEPGVGCPPRTKFISMEWNEDEKAWNFDLKKNTQFNNVFQHSWNVSLIKS